MDIRLEPSEARVLGVLVEKDLTTPDQYPLSLNSLQAGCNQKSNRDPVVQMAAGEAFSSVERLRMMRLAGATHPAGSRVERFAHNARQTLAVGDPELAVLAELLLRGPQTCGDLRARASRMSPMATQEDLARVLEGLRAKELVRDVGPAPGSRAGRVTELLSARGRAAGSAPAPAGRPGGDAASGPPGAPADDGARPVSGAPGASLDERVRALESTVARLERGLEGLATKLGERLD